MLIKDCQPCSLVEDEGFSAFVMKLDPDYVLPTKKALKTRVASQCDIINDSVASEVERADFISLTSDTWTSTSMNTYVSVTGHLVTEASQLCTFLLGVCRLPENHKAVHLEEARNQLVASRGLHSKVAAFVTETSDNMSTMLQKLGVLLLPSFAHVLNQVVKMSMEATTELQEIRSQARTIVAFFKSNPVAKERLAAVQKQLNRPGQKLLLEVESRWNSSFSMLQCLFHQREAVAASLSTLDTDISPLGSADYEVIHQCLGVLDPFHQATGELASERRVSASKIIPLVRMLRVILMEKRSTSVPSHPTAAQLSSHLQRALQTSCGSVESEPVLALATLLDPRFKVLAFGNPGCAQDAVKQLTSECAVLIRVNSVKSQSSPSKASASPASPVAKHTATWTMETAADDATATPARLASELGGAATGCQSGGLWEMFDSKVGETQSVQSSTADAAVEVQRYLSDTYLHRGENPMHYWERHSKVYPHLFSLARKYLSVPASALPCHRLFTKAGEVFNKRRSCLSMNAVEHIMLLNEGLV
ncbi:zinc finger BED domain-containing protein 4-like isoform X2 [Hypomesus transpacificus]|nr:zinc finger BED domain-containing protein 4-like isoform X2 [Hypomesus transpacificus]